MITLFLGVCNTVFAAPTLKADELTPKMQIVRDAIALEDFSDIIGYSQSISDSRTKGTKTCQKKFGNKQFYQILSVLDKNPEDIKINVISLINIKDEDNQEEHTKKKIATCINRNIIKALIDKERELYGTAATTDDKKVYSSNLHIMPVEEVSAAIKKEYELSTFSIDKLLFDRTRKLHIITIDKIENLCHGPVCLEKAGLKGNSVEISDSVKVTRKGAYDIKLGKDTEDNTVYLITGTVILIIEEIGFAKNPDRIIAFNLEKSSILEFHKLSDSGTQIFKIHSDLSNYLPLSISDDFGGLNIPKFQDGNWIITTQGTSFSANIRTSTVPLGKPPMEQAAREDNVLAKIRDGKLSKNTKETGKIKIKTKAGLIINSEKITWLLKNSASSTTNSGGKTIPIRRKPLASRGGRPIAEGYCSISNFYSPLASIRYIGSDAHFGYRINPYSGRRKFHDGIDLHTRDQYSDTHHTSVIYAVAPGFAVLKDSGSAGYGKHVIIDHGNGIETMYGHVYSFLINTNTQVVAGQPIAIIGTSGASTGVHLHFRIHVNGLRVDPEPCVSQFIGL